MSEDKEKQRKEKRQRMLNLMRSDYDYVRFTWSDMHGASRGKVVPARNVKHFIDDGVGVYCGVNLLGPANELWAPSNIEEANYPNGFVVPDPATLHRIPWSTVAGNKRMGQVLCEVHWGDGQIQKAGPRYVARRQLEVLDDMGFELKSAFEMELALLEQASGETVFKGEDYCCNQVFRRFEPLFMEADKCLLGMRVDLECFHSEHGSGQFECVMRPTINIQSADNAFLLKHVMKELAPKYGWMANFMAKITLAESGVGTHFNFSIWDKVSGHNAFHDAGADDNLSQLAKYWIGGFIKHAPALTALCCPTINCYRRLHQPWAPDLMDWEIDSRSVLLRVKNYSASATYMENRLPSGLCNPYLVLAGTLAAGIDGIKNKIVPPTPGDKQAQPLPSTLDEALSCLKADKAMVEALGQEFVDWFIGGKRAIDIGMLGARLENVDDEEKLRLEVEEYSKLI